MTHAARAGSLHHAALVVQHSSDRFLTRCVAFLEDQITGYQLVQRSGIAYQSQAFGSMGNAICQLDYEPQDVPSSCFGSGAYWQYFHRTSSGWAQSSAGASSTVLHDGDMDGWRYGSGQVLANLTFTSVCTPNAQPIATATTHPTRTPAAARTATAPASHGASVTPAPASPATTATASLVAMAPTGSPGGKTVLAVTGPTRPPPSPPIGIWLLLGGAASLLVGLIGINLRRRHT